MTITPSQLRNIDPFASYNSNAVNTLTRMITRGSNCIFGVGSLDVSISDGRTLTLSTGKCFKDDVLIEITSEFTIDVTDSSFYSNGSFSYEGIFYVCLNYTYVKSKPAPQATIRILDKNQHAQLTGGTNLLFLKAFKVETVLSALTVTEVYNYDPDDTTVKREYPILDCGIEHTLPTFVASRDESRLVYCQDTEMFYYGASNRWESFSGLRENADTRNMSVGYLGYFSSDSTIHAAIATASISFADCVVVSIGEMGNVKLFGYVENIPIQSGITIVAGDDLYLSSTEAGKCTNVQPVTNIQFLGTCVENNGNGTLDMWFNPNGLFALSLSSIEGRVSQNESDISNLQAASSGNISKYLTFNVTSWILDGTTGLYYADINISSIGRQYLNITCYDVSDNSIVIPYNIVATSTSSKRIWMPVNGIDLNIIVSG